MAESQDGRRDLLEDKHVLSLSLSDTKHCSTKEVVQEKQTVYILKLTADKKRLDQQTHQDADFLLQQHVAPAHRLLVTGLLTVILLCLIGQPAVDGRLRCTYTKFGYIALNLHTS